VHDFCSNELHDSAVKLLQIDPLFDDSNYNKGMVHGRFLEYDIAVTCLEQAKKIDNQNLDLLDSLLTMYHITSMVKEHLYLAQEVLNLQKSRLESDNPNHPDLALAYNNLAIAYVDVGEYYKAIEFHNKALSIRLTVYGDKSYHKDIGITYSNLATAHYYKGEYDVAIQFHRKALEIEEKVYSGIPNHPYIAATYLRLGNAFLEKGEYDEAENFYNRALEITLAYHSNNPNHPDISSIYTNLGAKYHTIGEYERATEFYQIALKMDLVVYAAIPNHPNISISYSNLASLYASCEEYDKAMEFNAKALSMRLACYGEHSNHPLIASSYASIGRVFLSQGDYDSATYNYNKALMILEQSDISNLHHVDIASILNSLGNAHCDRGEYYVATIYYNRALSTQSICYGQDANHPDIAGTCNNLGLAYTEYKKFDLAMKFYQKALFIQNRCYGQDSNNPQIAGTYNNLAMLYTYTWEYNMAIHFYDEALKIYLVVYARMPNHSNIASVYNNIGMLYSYIRQHEQALEFYKKALNIELFTYSDVPNHPDITASYANIGNSYRNLGKLSESIEYHTKALYMKLSFHSAAPAHPDIATSHHSIASAYIASEDYDLALSNIEKAIQIYELNNDISEMENALILKQLIMLQNGNLALLSGDTVLSNKYYSEINDLVPDFTSEEFINGQLEYISYLGQHMFLLPAINSLKVLLLVDPELKFNNHYHDLGCYLASVGKIEDANDAFVKGITQDKVPVRASLYAEYAQFLICNRDSEALSEALKHLPNYLHNAVMIEQDSTESLFYEISQMSTVCITLKELIAESLTPIAISPRALSYYLLIKYPEYIKEGSNLADVIESFLKYCQQSKSEVTLRLVLDVYDSIDHKYFTEDMISDISHAAIWLASYKGDEIKLKELVCGHKDSLDLNDDRKFVHTSPLIQAIISNHKNIIEFLLQSGVDPNLPIYDGNTPMHMAHHGGNIETIRLLSKYHANINTQNYEEKTPLHCLLEQENIDPEIKISIIKEFSHLYDFSIQDNEDETPLDYARQHCSEVVGFMKPWFHKPDNDEEIRTGAEQLWNEDAQSRLPLELSGEVPNNSDIFK
jgi:tetratricopeptide (TPR) repeat protein